MRRDLKSKQGQGLTSRFNPLYSNDPHCNVTGFAASLMNIIGTLSMVSSKSRTWFAIQFVTDSKKTKA